LIIGTGATIIELEDCGPDALALSPVIENWKEGWHWNLTALDIMKHIDTVHLDKVFAYHWIETLVAYVPTLAHYWGLVERHCVQATQQHAINPKWHTKVHPLGTNCANEVSMKGMYEALTDFFDQVSFNKISHEDCILFCSGDGKTFENIH